jgi:hypothetical protein
MEIDDRWHPVPVPVVVACGRLYVITYDMWVLPAWSLELWDWRPTWRLEDDLGLAEPGGT